MTNKLSKYFIVLLTILVTLVVISNVSATDIIVTTTGYTIEGQEFVSSSTPLGDAVAMAQDNETINVKDGIYCEQICINKSITLNGSDNAILKLPESPVHLRYDEDSSRNYVYNMIIYGGTVTDGKVTGDEIINANINGFKFDANNYVPGSGIRYSVLVVRNANSNITNLNITNISVSTAETFGITVDGNSNTNITNNTIYEFSRGGISIKRGYTAITGNTINGPNKDKNVTWAPNAIQIADLAQGIISKNIITGCGWTGERWTGTTMLLYGADNVTVSENQILNSQVGIYVCNCPGASIEDPFNYTSIVISNNTFINNTYSLYLTNYISGCNVSGNNIHNSEWAIIATYTSWYKGPEARNISIHNNKLYNSKYNAYASKITSVDMTHNYWGTTEYGEINSKIYEDPSRIYFAPYYTDAELKKLHSPIVNINKNKVYSKIQDAIDDADEFDTINVKDGVYCEQICVNKSITLNGSDNAILKLPESPVNLSFEEDSPHNYVYNVFIYGGTVTDGKVTGDEVINANINGFKFDANNYSPTDKLSVVLVRNANTNITNLNITNIVIKDKITIGILTYASNTNITNNTIFSFSRGGICVKGGYSNITGNTIMGPGKNKNVTWAPNGIQIGNLAEGIVSKNTISGCGWPGDEWSGTALLVVDTDNVTVSKNNVLNSESGIYVADYAYPGVWINPVNNITVINNNLINNTYSITVKNDVNGCNISGNKIYNSDKEAISIEVSSKYTGLLPRNISIQDNEIYDSEKLNVYVSSEIQDVNMSHNYWGTTDYLDIRGKMYGSVIFTPYYADSNKIKVIRITDEINYQFSQLSERLTNEGIINNINLVNKDNYESFEGLKLEKENMVKIIYTDALDLSDNIIQSDLINLNDKLKIKLYGVYLSGEYLNIYENSVCYEFENINKSDVLKNLSELELYEKLIIISDGEIVEDNEEYIDDYKLINNTLKVNLSEVVTCYLDIEKPKISKSKISPNGMDIGTYNLTASAKVTDNGKIKEVYIVYRNTRYNLTSTDGKTYNTTLNNIDIYVPGTYTTYLVANDTKGNTAVKLLYITILNNTIKKALGNQTSNITIEDEVWGDIKSGGIRELNNSNISLTEITVKNETLVLPKLQNVSVVITAESIESMDEISNSSNLINISNVTTEEELETIVYNIINKTKVITNSGFNISNMTLKTTSKDNKVKSEIKFTAENTTKKGYTIMRLPIGDLKLTEVLIIEGTEVTKLKENDYNSTLGWYRIINNNVVEITLIQDPEVSLVFESLLPSSPDTPTPNYNEGGDIDRRRHGSSEVSTITLETGQVVSKLVGTMLSKARIIIGADTDINAAKLLSLNYEYKKTESAYGTDSITINSDTLIVGGPMANPLANKYDRYYTIHITNDNPGKDTGIIQTHKINGYQVIYIAGSDRVGTKVAVQYYLNMSENVTEPLKIKLINGKPMLIN
ncbi:hypothetical protein J3E07_000615 [Methanococcus voltae]|uniref:Parallel beta-helix repeat protein n=1 Tax=Methanococcus voltae TaxID=2188 RepID=A0A8J7RG53_METVO|nr:hypothetical protein [Methanococcus voltae]